MLFLECKLHYMPKRFSVRLSVNTSTLYISVQKKVNFIANIRNDYIFSCSLHV